MITSEKDFIIIAVIVMTILVAAPILVQALLFSSIFPLMSQQDQLEPPQLQEMQSVILLAITLGYGGTFVALISILTIWYVKVKRRRMLTCSRCGNKVTFDIAVCPYCGEVIGPERRTSVKGE